jgi:hypothetical protein
MDREEALAKLTRRYFNSHGPATLQDFIWWSGLTAADARHGIALTNHDLRETIQPPRHSRHSAHFLPVYDEYLVAYQDRSAVGDSLGPALIVDGRIAGIWKRTGDKISVELSRTLSNSEQRIVTKAADRYAAFLGHTKTQSLLLVPFRG